MTPEPKWSEREEWRGQKHTDANEGVGPERTAELRAMFLRGELGEWCNERLALEFEADDVDEET